MYIFRNVYKKRKNSKINNFLALRTQKKRFLYDDKSDMSKFDDFKLFIMNGFFSISSTFIKICTNYQNCIKYIFFLAFRQKQNYLEAHM